ncbi:MAG: T9SS type A sorting domain-containing protein [Armatimonadetes bacterium]|nr:T9SS type A sorting domain-containing protein [Armatimonadota bacterium]
MKKTLFILMIFYIISANLNAAERRHLERPSLERDPNATVHSHQGSSTDELFDLQFCYPLGVGDGEAGIECDGNYFYTTKWNGNAFYKYELDGTYIGEFTVDGCPGSIRDLAYDGQYFYGAAADNTVYEMDFENQIVISTITAPIAVRAIAYDEYADGFWANNWSDTITLFDRNGTTLDSFPCGVFQSYYGFAYDSISSGGPFLWGYCQDGASLNQLVQFDIATGLETGINFNVFNATPLTGIAGGLFITNQIFPGLWIIGGLCQNDVIWGLELAYAPNILVPGSPQNFSVVADPGGDLIVDLSWICPTLNVIGDPLTELLEMRVYRDNELIYTDFEPVIGGPGNCTDNTVPVSGLYDYKIVGYNSWGEGIPVIETFWVGEDVPAAVENLLLEQTSPGVLSGTLTWTNPTTGLNGGAFNEPILGYHIIRSDGVMFELAGIATSYVDNTIPFSGNYNYTVQAYNVIGDGGPAASNWVLIGDPGLLINEDFSGYFPPAGWFIHGDGQNNWSSSSTNNAGGYAPEAKFSWSPSFIGVSRLVTYLLNTVGNDYCMLEFNHFVHHFEGSYFLKIQTTSDEGATWNTGWELEVNSNVGPLQESINFTTPDIGSDSLRIAFTFEGDSWNINYWYIDDVLCGPYSPWIGFVSIDILLQGGNGNIEEVEVFIDNQTFHPDSLGNVFLELWPDYYDISAELTGYFPAFENNVWIAYYDTTYVDMQLHFLEPPTNLTFEIVAPHVVLNWNAPQTTLSIDEYNIYRDGEYLNSTNELFYMDENVPLGTHEYYVTAKYDEYESGPSNIIVVEMTATDISSVPLVTELKGNYPNPFNPETVIRFSIKNGGNVKLEIYNTKGQHVRTLVNEYLEPNFYSIIWNGTDNNNKPVSSGIYFYKLKAGELEEIKKMILMK